MKNILLAFLVLFGVSNLWAHTIKMTTGKLELNTQNKTCKLTLNFFIDDFESELIKMYPQPPFDYKVPNTQMQETIESYVLNNVSIELNQVLVNLSITSIYKTEDNVCQVIFNGQLNEHQEYDIVTVKNTLLFSSFDKQSNILHVYVDGEKKQIFRFFAGVPVRTERF
ncbi:hypothetical protein QVZ41_00120 [Wenyingzhuangia sp. chi5]|uniref:GerMN domain-containing protein n=1 Tax=Wenyingzhuangia gilva TaxID=3057677 RepID=A0ABT8VMR9_9FLAO|nr:DUF6702 family protein [Wenyingzhuangia sp. chi5]MDO3693253.1 hypothetical protein [Wenyingzhuangia sp. chi5]